MSFQHIRGYPIVNDVVSYYQKKPYGKKSLELGHTAYQVFVRPLVPCLKKPYELYLSVYVEKADRSGTSALKKIDKKIRVIRDSTESIQAKSRHTAFYPIVKIKDAADHICDVYNSEAKSVGGRGVVATGKSILSTGIVLTAEALDWVSNVLRSGKGKAKRAANKMKQ